MPNTEVGQDDATKPVANIDDSTQGTRAVLPEALPVARKGAITPPDSLGEPLSIEEVAKLIGCSVWTVRQRCLPSGLPHFRLGGIGKLIFYKNQIVRWILEHQRQRGGNTR